MPDTNAYEALEKTLRADIQRMREDLSEARRRLLELTQANLLLETEKAMFGFQDTILKTCISSLLGFVEAYLKTLPAEERAPHEASLDLIRQLLKQLEDPALQEDLLPMLDKM